MSEGRPISRAVFCAVLVASWFGSCACAWAVPPMSSPGGVLLSFGARYSAGGESRTHSGLDLAGQAGERVSAPVGGKVTFAGRVPGGDGTSMLACTIEAGDGSRVTLMPLEFVQARSGDAVGEGEAVGTLAAVGDESSPDPHLHLSLRRGTLYVDPSSLLAGVPAAPDDARPKLQPGGAGSPAVSLGAGGATGAQAAAPAALAPGVSLAPAPGSAPAAVAPATAPERAGAGGAAPAAQAAAPQLAAGAPRQATAPAGDAARRAAPQPALRVAVPPAAWALSAALAFAPLALLAARSRRPRYEALLSDVRPVRDDVAAAVDRC